MHRSFGQQSSDFILKKKLFIEVEIIYTVVPTLLYRKVTQLYRDMYSLKYLFHYDLSQDSQYATHQDLVAYHRFHLSLFNGVQLLYHVALVSANIQLSDSAVCLHISPLFWISFPSRFSQFSSVTQSCPTLCDPMNCSTPGLPVHHQLLESTQTHVH